MNYISSSKAKMAVTRSYGRWDTTGELLGHCNWQQWCFLALCPCLNGQSQGAHIGLPGLRGGLGFGGSGCQHLHLPSQA